MPAEFWADYAMISLVPSTMRAWTLTIVGDYDLNGRIRGYSVTRFLGDRLLERSIPLCVFREKLVDL